MSFEAAVLSRLGVIEESQRFNEECREQIEPLQEERDALAALFVNLLTVPGAPPLLQLRDGRYVFLKSTTTTRAISEARLRAAVAAITPAQLERLQGRLADAVEENLMDECTAVKHRPVVAVARPSHVSAQRPPTRADDAVERSALRMVEIDGRLKTLRQRRNAGRAQCRQAVAETDTVLHEWMLAGKRHRQRVEIVPESGPKPAPASADLPALPTVGTPAISTAETAAAPIQIASTQTQTPTALEVRRPHPRPNRLGKAPSIAVFTAALAELTLTSPDQLLAAALELLSRLRQPSSAQKPGVRLTVAIV